MSLSLYVTFNQPHRQFFCRQYAGNDNGFNFAASLSRISAKSPDLVSMRAQAESERNWLQFYIVTLPEVSSVRTIDVVAHKQSELLLRDHSPWLLDQYILVDVAGDGNCRAVTLDMYGHELL